MRRDRIRQIIEDRLNEYDDRAAELRNDRRFLTESWHLILAVGIRNLLDPLLSLHLMTALHIVDFSPA
jgi:hypothetical protein